MSGETDARDMCRAAVRKLTLTGRKQEFICVEGITADSLNSHYAPISTDSNYCQPLHEYTASENFYG